MTLDTDDIFGDAASTKGSTKKKTTKKSGSKKKAAAKGSKKKGSKKSPSKKKGSKKTTAKKSGVRKTGGKKAGQTHRNDGGKVVNTKGRKFDKLTEPQRVNFFMETPAYKRAIRAAEKKGVSVSAFFRDAINVATEKALK